MTFFIFLASAAIFTAILLIERRTVYCGFFFLLTVALFGVFMLDMAAKYPEWFSAHFAVHLFLDVLILFLMILLVAYPLVLVPVFLFGGTILMKKEGVRPRNILSLLFAGGLFVLDIIFPLFFDVRSRGPSMIIYWYITLMVLYLVLQLASFWIADVINLIHVKKNMGLRYVVVLGAGLKGDRPTPLLKSRIDRGIAVYRENPGCRIIFSGGQGADEVISESEAMARYAVEEGVAEEDIIREDRSSNTEENIRFSSELMENREDFFAVVTNSYHVMRALMIAKRQRLKCIGYGARTKLYFSLNAFLREYAGYFRDTKKMRAVHLAALTFIYIIFVIFGLY